jgi:hypothetical protein
MNAFVIELDNKPGALADVTEAIGQAGINITAVTGATCGGQGRVVFAADDESAVRTLFGDSGRAYTETEIVTVDLPHAPGALARVARQLAMDGINIEAVMPMGMAGDSVTVGFVTDDPVTAGEVLTRVAAGG